MKKIYLIMLVVLLPLRSFAGDGDNYLNIGGGWQTNIFDWETAPHIANVTLGLELEGKYHNAWELNLDLATAYVVCPTDHVVDSKSFFDYKSFGIGVAYKPVLSRAKNSLVRWRIGANIGANDNGFQTAITGGIEYSYSFKNRMQLFILQKNDIVFWSRDNFRNGVIIGLKLPLNN